MDCCSPSEAYLLPTLVSRPSNLDNYREELTLSLRTARNNAASRIRRTQTKYKKGYDRSAKELSFEWASGSLLDFPVRKQAKTASCHDPGMVHTVFLPSTILMFLSPRCTSPVRNPSRCTSHECAYVPSTILLNIIGMVATSKGLDVTPTALPTWSLMVVL